MMIAFGLSQVPDTLRRAPTSGPHCLPLDRSVLRLWDLVPQTGQSAGAGQDATGQLNAIEDQLVSFCGTWNRSGTGFVQAYLAALRDAVTERGGELADRAGPVSGLVQPLHWALGAPLPMPRAWPLAADGRMPAAPVDIAFHVNGRLTVLCLGGATRLPSQRRYLQGLTAQGARVLDLAADDWDTPGLLERLGPGFADPFDFPGLPQSPFRTRALRKPMPAEA